MAGGVRNGDSLIAVTSEGHDEPRRERTPVVLREPDGKDSKFWGLISDKKLN